MGLKITGLAEMIRRLSNDAEQSSRGSRDALVEGGEKIAQRAKEYAPIDEGNLEDAITSTGVIDKGSRRKVVDVYVDTNHAGTRAPTVEDYYLRMHEGSYNLGSKSREKDGGSGKVGPKYLERAFIELEPEISRDVEDGLKRGIGH